MIDLKVLQTLAKKFTVLYVEDNETLRNNAAKFLQKIFPVVFLAADGVEGLNLFKKHHPSLVITDIMMPNMDGFAMSQEIKNLNPKTEIIIMSAFDDKEKLLSYINLHVFHFVKKPVKLTTLTKVLHEALKSLEYEWNKNIFQAQLKKIFNYQSSMIVMLRDGKPIIANQPFLDFYGISNIQELNKNYSDIGEKFLKFENFLYSSADENWHKILSKDCSKIFNVKMNDKEGNPKHFILKCRKVPEDEGCEIISFDDITELNLLDLYTKKQEKSDPIEKYNKSIYDILKAIQRNNAKLSVHNYYKGLSITNDAELVLVKDSSFVIKTSHMQQRAILADGSCLIVSEALPYDILSTDVKKISFDEQTVELENNRFVSTSPDKRETVRLEPEATHKVALFIHGEKYQGDVSIADISIKAVKLRLGALPAGLHKDDKVVIDMVFTMDRKPININTKASLFRKSEREKSFDLVFMFEDDAQVRETLVKYIAKRQMAIIREFKGLQNA